MKQDVNVLLAEHYDDSINPSGWMLSEKLDGVRVIWDGSKMVSRNGNVFPVPDWFMEGLPKGIQLDGELWLGRGDFQKTLSIVKTAQKTRFDGAWKRLKFMVFDIPVKTAGTFEVRYQILTQLIKQINKPHIELVPQTLCPNRAYFDKAMAHVITQGGEGLMLRNPNSIWEGKRSHSLLKAKPWYDAEAKVIGYQQGENGFIGVMGALICKTVGDSKVKNGMVIKVGTGFDMKTRALPPIIGETITYRYRKLSDSGKPVHPAFVCVREDI